MSYGNTQVGCWWSRTYEDQQNYLIVIWVSPDHGTNIGAYPMARAVIDDYGTLVIVRGWI